MTNKLHFNHETFVSLREPAKGYTGHVAAVKSFNGISVVLMCESEADLIKVIKELQPNLEPDTSLFMQGVLLAESKLEKDF